MITRLRVVCEMDGATCPACRAEHGHIYTESAIAVEAVPHPLCDSYFGCRCKLVREEGDEDARQRSD